MTQGHGAWGHGALGQIRREQGVRLLDAAGASLAAGVPPAPVGTIYFRSAKGGIVAPPKDAFTIVFGRDAPNVHVPVGVGDRYVSRELGRVTREHENWVLANHGKLPLRLPGSTHLLSGASAPIATGYTPIVVKHRHGPAHIIEVFVVPPSVASSPAAADDDETCSPATWQLSATERLALIVLGQRYLRHEAYALPQSWSQAAEDLRTITGDDGWGTRRVERIVEAVRLRLSRAGVAGLTRDEVGEPVGNSLNHNLITELLLTTTLVPPDLTEIDALGW